MRNERIADGKRYDVSHERNRKIKSSDYGDNKNYLTKPSGVTKSASIRHPELPGAELNVMSGVNSLAVNLTPNQSLEMIPVEYPLFNHENSAEEYTFNGIPAWNGSIVQQSVMLENTIFNSYFDSVTSRVKLRYGFYNYTSEGMNGQNVIFQRAVIAGISQLDSTLYRDLIFNTSGAATGFQSGMPGITDVRVLSLLSYQTFLQNMMLVLSAYVRFRKLDKVFYTMCYKRGYNAVRDLMLQAKKSVFEAKIQNLAKMLGDEFFDYEWFNTWRAFSDGVSRQSNAIDDPLLSTVCTYYMPACKLAPTSDPNHPYFDTTSLICGQYQFSHPLYANRQGNITRSNFNNLDLWSLAKAFIELTNPHNVLEWARTTVTTSNNAVPAVEYFNNMNNIIDAITEVFNKFKSQVVPIDTFMNVAKRSNWLRWNKTDANTVFNVSEGSIELKYNKFLSDLITNIHFGPSNFHFDQNSQAYSGFIAWYLDKETASYEQHTGGLPYLSSVRNFERGNLNQNDPGILVPQLFDIFIDGADTIHNAGNLNQGSNGVINRYINHTVTNAINRNANSINITSNTSNLNAIQNSQTLARLNIPDGDQLGNLSVKVPSVTLASRDNRIVSCVYRLLTNTFYAGSVTETTGKNVNLIYLDPNLIGFVDWQMKPTSLQVQNYIYTSAPFSGVGYNKSSDLGSVSK